MNSTLDIQLLESQSLHLLSQKSFSRAALKIQRALKHNPHKNGYLYSHLADILAEKKQFTKAQQTYHKSTLINPNFTHAYYNWAVTLAMQEKYAEASTKLTKVIQLNPWNVEAIHQLGKTYLKQQLYTEADQAFRVVANISPRYSKVYGEWAYARYFLRDFEGAKRYLYKGLRMNQNDLEVCNMLGYILLTEKNYEEAVECFKKAIEKDQMYSLAWLNWSLVLMLKGEEEEAMEKFNQGVETMGKGGRSDRKREIVEIYKQDSGFLQKYMVAMREKENEFQFVECAEGLKKIISMLEKEEICEGKMVLEGDKMETVGV